MEKNCINSIGFAINYRCVGIFIHDCLLNFAFPNSYDSFSSFNFGRNGRGRFIQDDYPRGDSLLDLGLGEEPSCVSLVICELPRLRTEYQRKTAWTGYLSGLAGKAYYVSPHTGDLIASD